MVQITLQSARIYDKNIVAHNSCIHCGGLRATRFMLINPLFMNRFSGVWYRALKNKCAKLVTEFVFS